MSAFSDYLENALLDLTINQVAYSPTTANVYVGLHTTSTQDDDSGVEVSGNAYSRVLGSFTLASGGSVSNNVDVTFPVSSGPWGTVTHFGVYDDITGGNLLYWAQLTTPKPVATGDVVAFATGNLILSLD